MSVELVTGYSGVGEDGEPNRHVSSAEDGARQAGTLGLGCYALSTGSKLSATMEDANTLVVADGDVVMNGRHVSLPDATSFTIPTGVQGQKVSNVAVLRYQKAADSVESVTPMVITGEPSADAPTDPAYNESSILDGDSPVDMPLYRVITDGVNAGDPESMFDILLPMAEMQGDIDSLRDSVSQNSSAISQDTTRTKSRTVCGTKVMTGTGTSSYVLLQKQELDSLASSVGARNSFPTIAATNGDWDSKNFLISGTMIQNGAALVWLDRQVSGSFRIDYAVTFPV